MRYKAGREMAEPIMMNMEIAADIQEAPMMLSKSRSAPSGLQATIKTRSKFPEAWIWTDTQSK